MTSYNFSEISDFEFEALCRDLLQEELGLSLELFTPGPDGGIDIRYVGARRMKNILSLLSANAGLKTLSQISLDTSRGRNSPKSEGWPPNGT